MTPPSERRERVEREMERWLPETTGPARLWEAMRYSALGGGKRARGCLVCIAAGALSGEESRGLPAAAAVELVHAYSLVHDDLPCMDDDDLRRGRPTCHRAFGEALAVLAGDALLTLAFEILARAYPGDVSARLLDELAGASGPAGMVGGQVLDLEGEQGQPSLEVVEEIHRRKTAALFGASAAMGGISVEAPAAAVDRLRRYGVELGLSFQIIDDILDVTSTPEALGKATRKDLDRGKMTYPGLFGVEESRRRAAAHLEAALEHVAPVDPHGGLAEFARELTRRES